MSHLNDQRIQQKVDEIKNRFEEKIAKIQENGEQRLQRISQDSPDPNNLEGVLNMTFDVKWKMTSIKFDIPKFTMQRETIIFDVPEVRMELKVMKFNVPATRMIRACLFKKPEITVSKKFPYRVTNRMTCVYGNKPEFYTKTIEIKTDIPQFNTKRKEIKFDKPVVKLETTEIKLNFPQFFLKELSGELREQKRDIDLVGQYMTTEISIAENEMKISLEAEITSELKLIHDEVSEELLKERQNISSYYDDSISKVKSAIKILKENNVNEEVSRLETELSNMVKEYQEILTDIDTALESISQNISESMSELEVA